MGAAACGVLAAGRLAPATPLPTSSGLLCMWLRWKVYATGGRLGRLAAFVLPSCSPLLPSSSCNSCKLCSLDPEDFPETQPIQMEGFMQSVPLFVVRLLLPLTVFAALCNETGCSH